MDKYYTYLWLREDGTPYYVGKGKGRRAVESDGHISKRPTTLDRIIIEEYESEKDAFLAEAFLISFYGRKDIGTGCLVNLTDGGEGGTSGYKHTEVSKQKIQVVTKERANGEANLKHWSAVGKRNKGRKRPDAAQYFKRWMDSLTPEQVREHCSKAGKAGKGIKKVYEQN